MQSQNEKFIQHELTKQALGLNGDLKLGLSTTHNCSKQASCEISNFVRHENLLDDEFDEAFESTEKSDQSKTEVDSRAELQSTVPTPVVTKDINEINRIWNEKRNKIQSDQIPTKTPETIDITSISITSETDNKPIIVPFKDRNRASKIDAIVVESSKLLISANGDAPISVKSETSFGLQNSSSVTIGATSEIAESQKLDDFEKTSRFNQEMEDLKSMALPKKEIEQGLKFDKGTGTYLEEENTTTKESANEKLLPSNFFKLPYSEQNLKLEEPIEFQDDDDVFESKDQSSSSDFVCCSVEQMMYLFTSPELNFSQIQPVVQVSGWKSLKKMFSGPPKLNKTLIKERDSIFALAKMEFNSGDEFHVSMLKTVYAAFTNTRKSCPLQGSHWSEVGFQGNNPSTDFRACGMLGLFQLTFLGIQYAELAQNLFKLSQHSTSNFPLAVLSINLTKISLQILREEKLNKICNSERKVIEPFNDLFIAMWKMFFSVWKSEDKTIGDFAFVLKDIETAAAKDSKFFMYRNLQQSDVSDAFKLNKQKREKSEAKLTEHKSAATSKNKYAIEEKNQSIVQDETDHRNHANGSEINFVGIDSLSPN